MVGDGPPIRRAAASLILATHRPLTRGRLEARAIDMDDGAPLKELLLVSDSVPSTAT